MRPMLDAEAAEVVCLSVGAEAVPFLVLTVVLPSLLTCAVASGRQWETGAVVDAVKPFVDPFAMWSLPAVGTWPCDPCVRCELLPAGGGGSGGGSPRCPSSGGTWRAPGSEVGPVGERRSGQDTSRGTGEGSVSAVSPLVFLVNLGRGSCLSVCGCGRGFLFSNCGRGCGFFLANCGRW